MKFHYWVSVGDGVYVMRVPGGLLYRTIAGVSLIPCTDTEIKLLLPDEWREPASVVEEIQRKGGV